MINIIVKIFGGNMNKNLKRYSSLGLSLIFVMNSFNGVFAEGNNINKPLSETERIVRSQKEMNFKKSKILEEFEKDETCLKVKREKVVYFVEFDDKANKDQSGVYVCKVTNARVPGLIMETKEMIATIKTSILPIEANNEVVVRKGDVLSVKGAETIALYTASGNLLSSIDGDEITVGNFSTGTVVIVIYTVSGVSKAVKYIL